MLPPEVKRKIAIMLREKAKNQGQGFPLPTKNPLGVVPPNPLTSNPLMPPSNPLSLPSSPQLSSAAPIKPVAILPKAPKFKSLKTKLGKI